MRGKWLIAGIAIILGILSIRQLSYTWYTTKIEREAANLSHSDAEEQVILDSLAKDTLNLGIVQYNYNYAKEKELKLGLDLKGGINVILQVQVRDLLENLADNSQNPVFVEALDAADIKQRSQGNRPYVDIFFEEFDRIRQEKNMGNLKYSSADIFGNRQNADLIAFNASDDEVKDKIKSNVDAKIGTAFQVISSRIDQFGVVQPVVQRLGSEGDGRILVELPGVKDTDRVKKLLQSTAKLEFWKNEKGNPEVVNFFSSLNPNSVGVSSELTNLQSVLQPSKNGISAFSVALTDTAIVNSVLKSKEIKAAMPASIRNYKFDWASKPTKMKSDKDTGKFLELYALSGNEKFEPLLPGDVVVEASGERSANSISNEPVVSMRMNAEGSQQWAKITGDNVGNSIAIVLDNLVYSAPNINEPISGGRSQISGDFTLEEAIDLANILQAGSLPASAKIVQADVVGPSLGKESIHHSLIAFVVAFVMILLWMMFFYSRAGVFANIALLANLLFLFGLLVGLWQATLTLPGIAGIILTMGMAVDANIIIFERVKEELAKGRNLKQAVSIAFSWKGGYSAIIDGNVTTFLTALVLFFFGKGPVQGFATTLMIGILTSLFCAIFLTRYFVERRLENDKSLPFYTSTTRNWFQNFNFDFISKRKIALTISTILVLISILSIGLRGFNLGIDFVGGRTYTVRFDKNVDANKIRQDLAEIFVTEDGQKVAPEVKTFGDANQIKISTKYKVNDESEAVEKEIKEKLYAGLKSNLPAKYQYSDFSKEGAAIGIISSAKVGPTIADDIKRGSFIAILFSIAVMFIYILVRFSKWQYSAGAVVALVHDTIITLGVFSIFKDILPFSMEIDQAFIAAILTVIGYSINDTVIVFDRIREFIGDYPRMPFKDLINKAINTTLPRTVNTSATTLLVILCIFLFGGESIRGFMFALLIGIGIGTYSSIFVASPLVYIFSKKNKKVENNQ